MFWRPWVCRDCVDRDGPGSLRPQNALTGVGVFFPARLDAQVHAAAHGHHIGRVEYRLIPTGAGRFGAELALSSKSVKFLTMVTRRQAKKSLQSLEQKRLLRRVGLLRIRYVATADGMMQHWGVGDST